MQRTASSALEVRALDGERREFEGIASTPRIDSIGDVLEPEGAIFELPLILLHQHDHRAPIGHVVDAQVSASGIRIKARLAKVAGPASLRERIDTAWGEIRPA
jgi:hypothetical protein